MHACTRTQTLTHTRTHTHRCTHILVHTYAHKGTHMHVRVHVTHTYARTHAHRKWSLPIDVDSVEVWLSSCRQSSQAAPDIVGVASDCVLIAGADVEFTMFPLDV